MGLGDLLLPGEGINIERFELLAADEVEKRKLQALERAQDAFGRGQQQQKNIVTESGGRARSELERFFGRAEGALAPQAEAQRAGLAGLQGFADPNSEFFKAQRAASTQAIQRQLAAQGLLGSGKQRQQLTELELGLTGQRLGVLGQLSQAGGGALGQLAGLNFSQGGRLAGLETGIGSSLASIAGGFQNQLAQLRLAEGDIRAGKANAIAAAQAKRREGVTEGIDQLAGDIAAASGKAGGAALGGIDFGGGGGGISSLSQSFASTPLPDVQFGQSTPGFGGGGFSSPNLGLTGIQSSFGAQPNLNTAPLSLSSFSGPIGLAPRL